MQVPEGSHQRNSTLVSAGVRFPSSPATPSVLTWVFVRPFNVRYGGVQNVISRKAHNKHLSLHAAVANARLRGRPRTVESLIISQPVLSEY